jgi:hypothetical protein
MDVFGNDRSPIPVPLRDYVIRAVKAGYLPNYRQPQTLHEKLVVLNTEIPDPRRVQMADKLFAKRYVAQVAPGIGIAKVLQVVRNPHEFDLATLPQVAVFKTNNSSGDIRVLQAPYDREEIVRIGSAWQAKRWRSWQFRIESHYLGIEPRLFAEEYIGDDPNVRIEDYRFYVFHGQVRFMGFVVRHRDRPKDRFIVDRSWQPLAIPRRRRETGRYELTDIARLPAKPDYFDTMVEVAEMLAAPFPFVRLDLYHQRNRIYFGEFTFAPFATFLGFQRHWDLHFGAYLDLDRARQAIAEAVPIVL